MEDNNIIIWNFLKLHHRNPKNTIFKRSKFILNKYIIFKFLLNKVLKISNSEYIIKNIINKNINQQYILTNNIFNYNVEKGVKHLLLWINPYMNENINSYAKNENLNEKDCFEKIIYEKLQEAKYEKISEIVFFENKIENRSINDIKHIQIFVKFK